MCEVQSTSSMRAPESNCLALLKAAGGSGTSQKASVRCGHQLQTQRLPPTTPSMRRGSQARRATAEDVTRSAATPATSEACLQSEHRVDLMSASRGQEACDKATCGCLVCMCAGALVSGSLDG